MKSIMYLCLCLVFYACCFTHQYIDDRLQVSLVSFTNAEIDTFLFRRYKLNSQFRRPLDTVRSQPFSHASTSSGNDTTFLFPHGVPAFPLPSGYEYEIVLPGHPSVTRISNIRYKEYEL